jgi:hypothetical protein
MADGGTRPAGADIVDATSPFVAVKFLDVREDRSLRYRPVFHARDQDFGGADFPLNVQDRASSRKSDSDSEIESSDTGEETDSLPRSAFGR